MAVPKKKISYSRTRKRFLSKKDNLKLYIQCKLCTNFIKLHRLCASCSIKNLSLQGINDKFKTNINNTYTVIY
jgi:ribosomal protein L32